MLRMRILLVGSLIAGIAAVAIGVVMTAHARAAFGWTAYAPLADLRYASVPSTPWPALALLLAGASVAGAAALALVLLRRGRWGLPR